MNVAGLELALAMVSEEAHESPIAAARLGGSMGFVVRRLPPSRQRSPPTLPLARFDVRLPGAVDALTRDRQVADIGDESQPTTDRPDNGRGIGGVELPRSAARPTLEVGVFRFGKDVELLATGGRVAVADVTELFEDTERSVHRRGGRVGVSLPAALDELAPGHVTLGRFEDLEDEPSLGRPAETAGADLVADLGPDLGVRFGGAGATRRQARLRCGRSRSSHGAKYRRNAAAPCTCYHLLQ